MVQIIFISHGSPYPEIDDTGSSRDSGECPRHRDDELGSSRGAFRPVDQRVAHGDVAVNRNRHHGEDSDVEADEATVAMEDALDVVVPEDRPGSRVVLGDVEGHYDEKEEEVTWKDYSSRVRVQRQSKQSSNNP